MSPSLSHPISSLLPFAASSVSISTLTYAHFSRLFVITAATLPPSPPLSNRLSVLSEKHINSIIITGQIFPPHATLGEEFDITLRVTNNISHAVIAQLQFRPSSNSTLIVLGMSQITLRPLDAAETTDITCTLLPTAVGFQELSGLVVVDLATKVEFVSESIFKIMVHDGQDE